MTIQPVHGNTEGLKQSDRKAIEARKITEASGFIAPPSHSLTIVAEVSSTRVQWSV